MAVRKTCNTSNYEPASYGFSALYVIWKKGFGVDFDIPGLGFGRQIWSRDAILLLDVCYLLRQKGCLTLHVAARKRKTPPPAVFALESIHFHEHSPNRADTEGLVTVDSYYRGLNNGIGGPLY